MKLPGELVDQGFLRRFIKVDHHVAAEDDVEHETKRETRRHQIEPREFVQPAKLGH